MQRLVYFCKNFYKLGDSIWILITLFLTDFFYLSCQMSLNKIGLCSEQMSIS